MYVPSLDLLAEKILFINGPDRAVQIKEEQICWEGAEAMQGNGKRDLNISQ